MPADLRDDHPDLVEVAPAPVLAGLERVDQRVAGLSIVRCRVLVRRVIATPNMATAEADPQMQPYSARPQAVLAARDSLGKLCDLDLVEMGTRGHIATARRSGSALLQVALNGVRIANLRFVRILVELLAGASLAKQVPAAVQFDLHRAQALAIGLERRRGLALGLLLATQLVLLCDEAFDSRGDAFVAGHVAIVVIAQ